MHNLLVDDSDYIPVKSVTSFQLVFNVQLKLYASCFHSVKGQLSVRLHVQLGRATVKAQLSHLIGLSLSQYASAKRENSSIDGLTHHFPTPLR